MQKKCIICKKDYVIKSNSQKVCEDCKTKECQNCKKIFKIKKLANADHKGKYCSQDCYLKGRFKQKKECLQCGKVCPMRFCCERCQLDFWNANGYHLGAKKRYWERKKELIKKLGGKCRKCGVDDFRLLDINHTDRSRKSKIKHYSWTKRLGQWEKDMDFIELLCANCHRLHTWEQMGYGKY